MGRWESRAANWKPLWWKALVCLQEVASTRSKCFNLILHVKKVSGRKIGYDGVYGNKKEVQKAFDAPLARAAVLTASLGSWLVGPLNVVLGSRSCWLVADDW